MISFLKRKTAAIHLHPAPTISSVRLMGSEFMPNNPSLPLLVYHQCAEIPRRAADQAIHQLFESNHWGGIWKNGVFDFHHYHSTAHEVLVVIAGQATLQLGGEAGTVFDLSRGDAILIPAGVAHKNLGANEEFCVMGAYPEGQRWDLCRGLPGERPQADENIARVPLPRRDPLYGPNGPLCEYWRPTPVLD